MKFGMFYELIAQRPYDNAAVVRSYNEAIEQIKYAEQMGFEYVWETEHHFTERFSYSSCPELFLSAIARETSTIRIGHAVVVLTLNNPIRVAERAAVLDILSNGRLEFGTGRGTSEAELGGFMVEPEDSRPMWEESLDMLPAIWMSDAFEWKGKYFEFPPRNVIPKPIQQPHPPLWLATVSPPSFELAAQKGLGVLSFSLTAPGQSKEAVKVYRDRIKDAEPVGAFVNNQIAAFTLALCAETDAKARSIGGFAAAAYAEGSKTLYDRWSKSPLGWRGWFGRDYITEAEYDEGTLDKLVNEGAVCLGSPDTCIETIKKWEELGIDQIMCLMQGGRIPHDAIMQSIRLFGEQVIPHFRKRDAAAAGAANTPNNQGVR